MAQEQKNRRYDELFPNLEEKAAAFDQIAAQFYEGNFGRMSKADLETLMFHLYIEQILKRSKIFIHTAIFAFQKNWASHKVVYRA